MAAIPDPPLETLNPLDFGGVVARQFRSEDDVCEDIPANTESPCFLARHSLPDVKENTNIIAVCGINDLVKGQKSTTDGDANPTKDGWFFSDFYLMHHLMKGLAGRQRWLTCVDPSDLITKYTQYVHGSPPEVDEETKKPITSDTCRIVLDRDMYSAGEISDIEVIHPDNLLSNFVNAIKATIRSAEEDGSPVLIMVFSHGFSDDHGLQMGGTNEDPNLNPRFTIENMKAALKYRKSTSGTRICLLTSACYSGGWAINPSFDLQFTSVTAAPAWEESLSWPVSGTGNMRVSGSPWVSSLAEVFSQISVEGFEKEADMRASATYAGFSKFITQTVRRLDTRMRMPETGASTTLISVHNPMFAAQGDEWEKSYSDRTGIPLGAFKDRWLFLKAAAGYQPPPANRDKDTTMCPLAMGERSFTYDQFARIATKEANEYMASFPGMDSKSKNVPLHNLIKRLRDPYYQLTMDHLQEIHCGVDYRMNAIMGAATVYKNFLRIEGMPDCDKVDMDRWGIKRGWEGMLRLVFKYQLFDEPGAWGGHVYAKGDRYITACIQYAGWDSETAIEKLDSLVKYNSDKERGISRIANTSRDAFTIDFHNIFSNATIKKELKKFGESAKKRIRSISPIRKRGRIPSYMRREGEGVGGRLESRVGTTSFSAGSSP